MQQAARHQRILGEPLRPRNFAAQRGHPEGMPPAVIALRCGHGGGRQEALPHKAVHLRLYRGEWGHGQSPTS